MVRRPCGSTVRASLRESELARSTFAADTERMTLHITVRYQVLTEIKLEYVRVGFGYVLVNEVADLPFDITRLIANGNLPRHRESEEHL